MIISESDIERDRLKRAARRKRIIIGIVIICVVIVLAIVILGVYFGGMFHQ